MQSKKRNQKKYIRIFRWTVKISLLLLFVIPLTFLANVPTAKIYSFTTGGLSQPPITIVPLSESVCSLWTTGRFSSIDPLGWILCPLGGIQALITGQVGSVFFYQVIIAILLFIIPILLVGNIFCGWICPLGTMIDAFDLYIRKFQPKLEAKREERSRLNRECLSNNCKTSPICPVCPIDRILVNKYGAVGNGVLLGTVVGSTALGFNVFCTICPIGISTRGFFHLKATTFVTKVVNPFFLELLILPAAAILMSLREKRFWCNKICPIWALLTLGAYLSPFLKPTIDPEKCIRKGCPKDCPDAKLGYCGACRASDRRNCEIVCPSNINLLDSASRVKCTKCLECYCECERGAIKIKLIGKPEAFVAVSEFFRRRTQKKETKQKQAA
ncbi:MAG: 4Fe-4S binding protein [Candidatus Bathyarchaeota archaeon]|nr:4Fe-4S binding protein [Candidatus Bathyarchaeota archaeon]